MMMRRLALLLAVVAASACGGSGPESLSLPPGKFADAPRISPDGQSIAFMMSGTGASDVTQLAVMPIGGHSIQVVATPDDYLAAPAWSPDGAQIFFTGSMGIQSVGKGGGALTPIYDGFATTTPDLSADGKTLVWATNGGGISSLDLATAGAKPVALHAGRAPRLSHDGKRLLFISGDKDTLSVLDLATQQVTDLADTNSYLSNAAWFADDLRIAYLSKDGIEIVTVADKSHHHVADEFAAKSLDLSLDGKTIVYAVNGQADLFLLKGF